MFFRNYLINIPDDLAAQRWMFWVAICYSLISIFGSAVTGILGLMALFAFSLSFFDKPRFELNKTETRVIIVIVSYVLVSFVFSLLKPNRYGAVEFFVNNSTFLFLFALLPVIRVFSRPSWTKWIYRAIGLGLILSGVTVMIQLVIFEIVRPHAFVANPLVLSTVAAGFSLISLSRCLENIGKESYFHLLAFIFACFVIFISGSRGAFLALVFSNTILIIIYWKTLSKNFVVVFHSLYVLLLISIVMFELLLDQAGFQFVAARFDVIDTINEYIAGQGQDASINARLEMLKGGWAAFTNAPWTGYGRQNIMSATSDILKMDFTNFSHLHNAFITEMVASGIPGLLTFLAVSCLPIYVAWNTQTDTKVLAIAMIVCWLMIIMTGIGFYHDITICYFILGILFFHIVAHSNDKLPT